MAINDSVGQQLLDVPMGDMIREMAFAIAEAQIKLDENSIEVAEMMGGLATITDDNGNVTFEDSRVFFGNEFITHNSAVVLFNSADLGFRRVLYTSMSSGDFTFTPAITAASSDAEFTDTVASLTGSTGDSTVSVPVRISMLELGFTPTFYQFVDTIIEVRIAISITSESSREVEIGTTNKTITKTKALRRARRKLGKKSKNKTVSTSQVNATYASKYSYSAEGSSLLRTKLAPVPPPAILEDRIRLLLANNTAVTPTE